MRRDVYQAIADPTRREIINLIANKSMNLNAIAGNFNISRPAISQQIKILQQCGLLSIVTQGRERFCEARLESLSEVSVWIEKYRTFWEERYTRLDRELVAMGKQPKRKATKSTKK